MAFSCSGSLRSDLLRCQSDNPFPVGLVRLRADACIADSLALVACHADPRPVPDETCTHCHQEKRHPDGEPDALRC